MRDDVVAANGPGRGMQMSAESGSTGWWDEYFDETFLQVYQALLPAEEAEDEVEAVLAALDLEPPARVLDLACGWGRHAIPLAARGFRVTGVDLSATLLETARTAALEEGVDVSWIRGDMRELELDGGFDAVICLFSSLGYSLSDADDLRVLRGVREQLRPGGHFLFETMHRDLVAREFVERDWWPGPDGTPVLVEREFDSVAGVSRETLRWGTQEKHHVIRVRAASEWAALVEEAGLTAEEWLGSWDLEPFSHQSERLVLLASRPE